MEICKNEKGKYDTITEDEKFLLYEKLSFVNTVISYYLNTFCTTYFLFIKRYLCKAIKDYTVN